MFNREFNRRYTPISGRNLPATGAQREQIGSEHEQGGCAVREKTGPGGWGTPVSPGVSGCLTWMDEISSKRTPPRGGLVWPIPIPIILLSGVIHGFFYRILVESERKPPARLLSISCSLDCSYQRQLTRSLLQPMAIPNTSRHWLNCIANPV